MKKISKLKTLVFVALGLGLSQAYAEKAEKETSTPYPLKTCVVSGETLDADAIIWNHEGRELQLCCNGCKKDFIKDPATYLKKLDEAYIGAYPLKHCLVSKEPLGSMGDAYVHHHKGELVLFCCKGCIKKFNKKPDQYLKELHSAQAAEKPSGKAAHDHAGHDHQH